MNYGKGFVQIEDNSGFFRVNYQDAQGYGFYTFFGLAGNTDEYFPDETMIDAWYDA